MIGSEQKTFCQAIALTASLKNDRIQSCIISGRAHCLIKRVPLKYTIVEKRCNIHHKINLKLVFLYFPESCLVIVDKLKR